MILWRNILGDGNWLTILAWTKKEAGRGAQPERDEMKKLILLKKRYQNSAGDGIRGNTYFAGAMAVFFGSEPEREVAGIDK